jgi:predicted RNA-binding Zn-ribbon protein involved in translation (DUF1610 family)
MTVKKEKGISVGKVVKSKKNNKYLECTFCGNKQTTLNNLDETAFWCTVCGRCNLARWKED